MKEHSKITIQPVNSEKSVTVNTSIPNEGPHSLYHRLVAFKNFRCFSSEQEVLRIALNDFLRRNGF